MSLLSEVAAVRTRENWQKNKVVPIFWDTLCIILQNYFTWMLQFFLFQLWPCINNHHFITPRICKEWQWNQWYGQCSSHCWHLLWGCGCYHHDSSRNFSSPKEDQGCGVEDEGGDGQHGEEDAGGALRVHPGGRILRGRQEHVLHWLCSHPVCWQWVSEWI